MAQAVEIRREALEQTGRRLLESTLLGQDQAPALDAFAHAAGAEGGCIVHDDGRGAGRAVLSSPSVADTVRIYLAGQAPPDSRRIRVVLTEQDGFVGDQRHYTREEIARDPFYAEFLRPRGFGWHAVALLGGTGRSEVVVSLKRAGRLGPYDETALATLDGALPVLRQATAIAMLAADAHARGGFDLLSRDGVATFGLDRNGRVCLASGGFERMAGHGIAVVAGRLCAPYAVYQQRLDRVVAAAVQQPGRPGALLLPGDDARRLVMRFVPATGEARDVFTAIAALGTAAWHPRASEPDAMLCAMLVEAGELTRAEARVAALISDGHALPEIAGRLAVSIGTARNHLKAVMQKLEVSRQSELVALISRIRG